MRTINVLNNSKLVAQTDAQLWAKAWTFQINNHVRPLWGGDEVFFELLPQGTAEPSSERMVLEDGVAGKADALGYHTYVSGWGVVPRASIDPAADAEYRCKTSITGGHEAVEMYLDPWCNREVKLKDGRSTLMEACDAWSIDAYGYTISMGGVPVWVPNFTTPAYWVEDGPTNAPMDYLCIFKKTFPNLPPGGYAAFSDGKIVQMPMDEEHAPMDAAAAHYRAFSSHRVKAYRILSSLREKSLVEDAVVAETLNVPQVA